MEQPQAQPRPPGPNGGAAGIPPPPVPQSSLWNRFRSLLITMFSTILTALVVGNAFYQRQQFYPSVVYITKSNPSMAVIYVQAFVFVILFGKLMRKIFFGRLRAAEFEHLMERSWYAVTETCLAFTVFKDDFSPKFVALFTLLLFLKSFHWLAEDRVDFMERSPTISTLFHIRVISLNLLLALVDIKFILYAYESTLSKGPSVQLVFGFEYAILMTIVANSLVKYVLHSIDLYSEHPWENKAVFMLYTELVIGLIKVILYIIFIAIMIRIYTLPLFAVRPMYLTMRAFKKAFNDVILSRRAIHNMNTCYPDATAEELAATDNVCIICREEMTASPATKKLPCNHIFHKNCLRSWFQRQQTCPTCRLDVLRAPQQQQRQGGPGAAAQQQNRPGQPQAPPPFDPHNIFAQIQAAARLQQQQQQQAGGNTAGATGTSTSQTNTTPAAAASPSSSNTAFSRPPFMPPPFPFFSPFNIPPPMPPPNFSGLTDEELRNMEGTERHNVEARIKCLRNIQVLLDAAVIQMQQYSTIAGATNRAPPTSQQPPAAAPSAPTAAPSTSTTAPLASSTTPSTSSASSTPKPGPETGATPKVKTAVSTKKDENFKDAEKIVEKMELKETSETSKDGDGNSTVKDELRKRRLAKFETTNE